LGNVEQDLGRYTEALQDYERAAKVGDSMGSQNYAALQKALTVRQTQRAQPNYSCLSTCQIVSAQQQHDFYARQLPH